MTSEKSSSSTADYQNDPRAVVAEGRRRLLKGGMIAAPVLLTLPSFSVAAESNNLQGRGVIRDTVTADEGKVIPDDFKDFLQVTRPVYRVQHTTTNEVVDIVNAGVSNQCSPGAWYDVSTLAIQFTPTSSCSGALIVDQTLTTSGGTYKVIAPVPVRQQALLIGFNEDGTSVLSVGKADFRVALFTNSVWASVGTDAILPQ